MFGQLKHFQLVVLIVLFSGNVLAQSPIAVNYLFTIGESGDSLGQFSRPQGLAVAPGGDIYVADTGNNRVQRFDKNGKFLAYLGGLGSGRYKGKSLAKTKLASKRKNYVNLLFLQFCLDK